MIKTVLITGANGFIGSHLVDALISAGYKLVILVRKESNLAKLENHLPNLKKYFIEDGIDNAITSSKPDIVIHLATKYIKSHTTPDEVNEMIATNINFPTEICEAMTKNKVKYFINTGTCFEYQPSDKPLDEFSALEPYNFYAATKIAFNNMLVYYAVKYNLSVIDLKLFFPFGENDNPKVVPFLIQTLLDGDTIDFSGGEQRLGYTYIKDICLAYLRAIEHIDKKTGFNTFNIGYDLATSLREIAHKLEKFANKKIKVNWGAKPYPDNEIFYMVCDNSKAKRELGWKPVYTFEQGLQNTFKYYKSSLTK